MRARIEVARLALPPLVLVAAALASACGDRPGDPSDVTGPTDPVDAPVVIELEAITVDDPLYVVLEEALQDELQAEATYEAAIATYGAVRPFSHIVTAEDRHATAVAHLIAKRGLEAPGWDSDGHPVPVDFSELELAEACAAGYQAELDNIAMYDAFLADGLPADVTSTFLTLRAASENNHAPAFARCM